MLKFAPPFRRRWPFHYAFWLVFHAALLAVNARSGALFFSVDQAAFWLALAAATAQAFFLGFALLFLWQAGVRRLLPPRRAETVFYLAVGFLAFVYVSDFFYRRTTGTGLGLFFTYLWRLSPADIRDMFAAAQISPANLLLILAVVLSAPLVLWGIVWASFALSRRRPLLVSSGMVCAAAAISFVALSGGQWIAQQRIDAYRWSLFAQTLPVYLPVFRPGGETVAAAVRVRPYDRLDRKAAGLEIASGHLPRDLSVFVVIAETVRQDFVTQELAPHLYAFQENNLSFRHAFCSGNSTHYSWFSLLFGAYPIYWNAQRQWDKQLGSPALQVLKKAGFSIHLYTKPHHLRYLGFGDLTFGANLRLVDEAVVAPDLSTAEADRYSVDRITERIRKGLPPGRHLYLLFLDATHHNYFFPEDFPPRFHPYIDDFSYLKWDYTPEDVEKIRNRYKNALYYMDSLFGRVIAALKETGAYDASAIGFAADHGEEFLEHGALIHGSNFFDPQMRVPILFRKPGGGRQRINQTIAGVDFFPTLLDLLGLYDQSRPVLQGRSALEAGRPPLAVLANNHADADPFDFVAFNGASKLRFRLSASDPLHAREVAFLGAYDAEDRPISFDRGRGEWSAWIHRHFSVGMGTVPFLDFPDPL